MYTIDLQKSSVLFGSPGESLLTNAIVDNVDSAISSSNIYPWAYSATLQNQLDERNFRTVATDVDLAAASRFSAGLFLADSTELGNNPKKNIFLSVKGSLNFFSEVAAPFKVYFILGRCNASSITQSDVTASNLLSRYIVLPEIGQTSYGANNTNQVMVHRSIDTQILKIGFDSTGYPLCFAFVIENLSSITAYNFDFLQASLQFQIWDQALQAYRVKGV
ncbi:hypothetical protein [Microviridae sp.]|nr:hypothetical protein [Microviridae sp.]